jgi:general secretion pathway protein I
MSMARCHCTGRGFTLIEVVVALFVIAIGIGALLTTLASSADSVGHLRDKSFAEWIALNRISELRLASVRPGPGTTQGEAEYARMKWRWRQQISDQGMAGIWRIDVSVGRAGNVPQEAGKDDVQFLTTAYGFLGTAAAAPSGIDPDWSLASLPVPNP